jgi:hypothetical protein
MCQTNQLPFNTGLELISINGQASNLGTTSLILSTSLQVNLMQVCRIILMKDGSADKSSGVLGGIIGLLILVV